MRICHSAEMLSMRFWCDWMCEWDEMEWAMRNVWMIVLFRISARFTPIRTKMVFDSVLVLDNYDNDKCGCAVQRAFNDSTTKWTFSYTTFCGFIFKLKKWFFLIFNFFCILNIEKINWRLSVLLLEIRFAMEVHFYWLSWTHAF